jgi:hypothetical protein
MRYVNWFRAYSVRTLRSPAFLVIAALFIALSVFALAHPPSVKSGVPVAYCVDGSSLFTDRLAESLSAYSGTLKFYRAESEESLAADVQSGRAECGYVIPSDIEELIKQGHASDKIKLYRSPSSVADRLSQEVFYGCAAQLLDRDLVLDYVGSSDAFSDGRQGALDDIGKRYDSYLSYNLTFGFDISTVDGPQSAQAAGVSSPRTYALKYVNAAAALLIYLAGAVSAAVLAGDRERGMFDRIGGGRRIFSSLFAVSAPVLLLFLAALPILSAGTLLVSGGTLFWGFLLRFAGFSAGVCVFSWLLCLVFRRSSAILCLIPVLLAGAASLSPILLDAVRLMPSLRPASHLFLPCWYLSWISSVL